MINKYGNKGLSIDVKFAFLIGYLKEEAFVCGVMTRFWVTQFRKYDLKLWTDPYAVKKGIVGMDSQIPYF